MRPMTVKQAEKWLEKMKSTNQNSFKELSKILKRYEKTSDDYDCFVKVNGLLLDHPDLTTEINGYLEEGNKFIVNQSEVEKINELVRYIRNVDKNSFQEIASYITRLHTDKNNANSSVTISEDQQNKLVRNHVLTQVRGKPELEAYAQKALFLSAEEMIKQLPLSHLRATRNNENTRLVADPPEPVVQPPTPKPEPTPIQPNSKMFPPFINQNEEKYFFRQFEDNLDPFVFQQILKVIHIYQLGIISRVEANQILKPHCNGDFQAIKDLIDSREADRRRNSSFRPLNDMDFTNVERATHSYVKMPQVYPHLCSSTSPALRETLNKKWVSVPRGTEEAFNVRIKNGYQENLIRAEDDRYEFDIYFRRLQKSLQIIDKVIEKLKEKPDDPSGQISSSIQLVISLGIIQTLYKNTLKEQREQFQFHLRSLKLDTLLIFQSRMRSQHEDLLETRNIHGIRTWGQIANKNWTKALDFRGHEFKRTQKLKMKAGVFLEQLKVRVNYLKSKGENKSYDTPFEDKKQFFSVLNSFQTSSRKQKCLERNIPTPQLYNIKDHKLPTLLPAMILAFENQQVTQIVYSFVVFYVDSALINQSQKLRSKAVFKQIMTQFFGLKTFKNSSLSPKFEQQKLFNDILANSNFNQNFEDWIQHQTEQQNNVAQMSQQNGGVPTFHSQQQSNSQYSFEPPKRKDNLVFYASENFYVFLRFFYALYERIIRMKQVAKDKKKSILFQILYYACIKTKEGVKFQDSLNILFGDYAYLFTTIYKLLESLQKSLNIVSLCPLYAYSLKHMDFESEQIYLLLLNRFMLNTGSTAFKLMRFTYEPRTHLLYINSLESYYKIDDQTKELARRRADITSKIQIYAQMKTLQGDEEYEPIPKDAVYRNQLQYCFEGNSIKMINLCSKEDYFVSNRIPIDKIKLLEEVKKNKKLREKII